MEPNRTLETVGERLLWWRLRRGLPQGEVCRHLEGQGVALSEPALSQYERGHTLPPLAKLCALAELYQVHPGVFLPSRRPFRSMREVQRRAVRVRGLGGGSAC